MMRHLPAELGAALVMAGDGKLRERLAAEAHDLPVAFPGFLGDRDQLAAALGAAARVMPSAARGSGRSRTCSARSTRQRWRARQRVLTGRRYPVTGFLRPGIPGSA